MPITAAKAPKTLPDHAKEIYAAAFNASYEGTCKDSSERDACASKIAWSAVKRKYAKDGKGVWKPKSDIPELSEISLYISKASLDKKSGEMRWTAVASDTEEDLTEESMTLELFHDFIQRAESGEEVPMEFRSEYWSGGMPYVSVSHYPDCNGKTSAGMCNALYVDGNRLKAKGTFADSELGRACFKSVCTSLYGEAQTEKKVRISIGFLDWAHMHGETTKFERKTMDDFCLPCLMSSMGIDAGKKKYLKGQLIHLALTREPANPRTDITDQVEVIKSMTTQKSDAESIIGKELAEKVEEEAKNFVGKSMAFVVKTDAEGNLDATEQVDEETVPEAEPVAEKSVVEEKSMDEPVPVVVVDEMKPSLAYGGASTFADAENFMKAQDAKWKFYDTWWMFESLADNIMKNDDVEDKATAMTTLMDEAKKKFAEKSMLVSEKMEAFLEKFAVEETVHPLDEAISRIKEVYDTVSSNKSLTQDERLVTMQEPFEGLGQVLKATLGDETPTEQPVSTSTPASTGFDVETLKTAFQAALQPLSESVSLLLQRSSAPDGQPISRQEKAPIRRSIVVTEPFTGELTQTPPVAKSTTPKLREIVERSIYGVRQ